MTASARLDPAHPLVGEQHAGALPGEVDRRGRPGRAGTDDEDVDLHTASLGGMPGYNPRSRRGSRVAKGGGL